MKYSTMNLGGESGDVAARLNKDFARVIGGDEQGCGELTSTPRSDVVWVVDSVGRIRAALAGDSVTEPAI